MQIKQMVNMGKLSSNLIIYVPWHKDRKSLGGLCEANQEVLTEIIRVIYQRVTMSLHIWESVWVLLI